MEVGVPYTGCSGAHMAGGITPTDDRGEIGDLGYTAIKWNGKPVSASYLSCWKLGRLLEAKSKLTEAGRGAHGKQEDGTATPPVGKGVDTWEHEQWLRRRVWVYWAADSRMVNPITGSLYWPVEPGYVSGELTVMKVRCALRPHSTGNLVVEYDLLMGSDQEHIGEGYSKRLGGVVRHFCLGLKHLARWSASSPVTVIVSVPRNWARFMSIPPCSARKALEGYRVYEYKTTAPSANLHWAVVGRKLDNRKRRWER